MKFSKRFARVSREDGAVHWRRAQALPLDVKLNALAITLAETATRPRAHRLQVSIDGVELLEAAIAGGETYSRKLDKPLALARGQHEMLALCDGFAALEPIEVTIEVDVSMALFS